MLKQLQIGMRAFLLMASRVWTCVCFLLKKQVRAISQMQPVKYEIFPLSPLSRHRLSIVKRKILVLDLDETLIHSHHDGVARPTVRPGTPPDFVLKVTIDRHPVRFFVHKRPHVDFFLDIVSQWYELVVFTASMEIYGAAVADKLDNNRGILRRRYYRQHCTPEMGSYTKDLAAICSDLASVFILDNSPGAYRAYPQAPDNQYLVVKVALILGITGACRRELKNITIHDIEHYNNMVLIKIPRMKNNVPRKFTVNGGFYEIFKKYEALRPENAGSDQFYLCVRDGHCTIQVIEINTFSAIPKIVAKVVTWN